MCTWLAFVSILDSVALTMAWLWAGLSLLRPVLSALLLHPGQNPLVEEQVGTGGQDLLQAGLSDRVVRNPQPLVAG